jgi:hypothetical protein
LSSYSIGGRSLTKLSPDELLAWRDVYAARVVLERRGGSMPVHAVTFAGR